MHVDSCGSPTDPTRSREVSELLQVGRGGQVIQPCRTAACPVGSYANPKGMAIGLGKINCVLLDYWYELELRLKPEPGAEGTFN